MTDTKAEIESLRARVEELEQRLKALEDGPRFLGMDMGFEPSWGAKVQHDQDGKVQVVEIIKEGGGLSKV